MSGAAAHVYKACGLSIASDAPIPGLGETASRGPHDVMVSMQGPARLDREDPGYSSPWYVSPEQDASGTPEMTIYAGQSGYRVTYGHDAVFLIDRDGSRICARWAASRTDVDAASYLAGSVLAFVLRLRGSVPLHASAVAIDGRGLLFAGDSWSGKSSIAAAFSTLGHSLVSDDIVRIDLREGHPVAYSAHPRVHVWSDSAAALFAGADPPPMHSPDYRKHCVDVLGAGFRFQDAPVPIEAVYVLKDRAVGQPQPVIDELPPRQAFIALIRHTYGGCLLDQSMRTREFDVLGRFVERVPVRELTLGDSLQDLVSSCRALAAHSV